MKLKSILAPICLVAIVLFSACDQKDKNETEAIKDHLVSSAWWNTNSCTEHNQLHFNNDGTGFLTLKLNCVGTDYCFDSPGFSWTMNDNGSITIIYSYASSANFNSCEDPDVPRSSETISISSGTTSFMMYDVLWTD